MIGSMKHRLLILSGWLCATLTCVAAPPNILVILADDLGYGDVSGYGAADIRTPHIDRLAKEGMLFTGMRANATVCSPSRAALLTGRYPDRVGVPGVIRAKPENSWGFLDPRTPTLAEELGRAGYRTALIGKWHLGLASPNLPNERGFDFFHGFLGDMMDSYSSHLRGGVNFMRRDTETIAPDGHATDLFAEWACDWLRASASGGNRPFFLYLAFNAPHFPIEPPAEWLERVTRRAPGMERKRALNVAFVEHLDDRIGRVLNTLDEAGLSRNTLVFFSSDNGGALEYAQSNVPWRGGKQTHYDGGLRVPFIARWPEQVPPGSRTGHEGLLFDVFATALDLAGLQRPPDIDSVSLLPVLRGGASDGARELYFTRREGGAPHYGGSYEALVDDGWKLLRNTPFEPYKLYNLRQDPGESTDLAGKHPGRVKAMARAIARHLQRGGAKPWQPQPGQPGRTGQ